jgi:hypothetical protein
MVKDDDASAYATKIVVVLNWMEHVKAVDRARTQTAAQRPK